MMKKQNKFLYWLISTCSLIFAAALGQYFGLWAVMDSKDVTKISWLICIITAVTIAYIGYRSTKDTTENYVMKRLWFLSDAMITLGMIGTVAGFLIMLGDSFSVINASDPASIQKTIQNVGVGMGTILITTLMGLIGSLVIKMQLVILDHEE